MKIPYGMSNFKALRQEKYLYVDKTKYIEIIENLNSKYVFFIRPRRFGKSLFLSALEHYYNSKTSPEFANKKNLKKALIIFSGKSDYLVEEIE